MLRVRSSSSHRRGGVPEEKNKKETPQGNQTTSCDLITLRWVILNKINSLSLSGGLRRVQRRAAYIIDRVFLALCLL